MDEAPADGSSGFSRRAAHLSYSSLPTVAAVSRAEKDGQEQAVAAGAGASRGASSAAPATSVYADARAQGFTGDNCGTCGGMKMVRNGSCLKCMDCGGTTGCS